MAFVRVPLDWTGENFRVESWKDGRPTVLFASDSWDPTMAAYHRECAARPTEIISFRHRLMVVKQRDPSGVSSYPPAG